MAATNALVAIEKIDQKRFIDQLIILLDHKDLSSHLIIETLGKTSYEDDGVCQLASEALSRVAQSRDYRDFDKSKAAIESLEQIGNAHAVQSLINALVVRDFSLIAHIARILGKFGDEQAIKLLVNAFKTKYEHTYLTDHKRMFIFEALDKFGYRPYSDEAGILVYFVIKKTFCPNHVIYSNFHGDGSWKILREIAIQELVKVGEKLEASDLHIFIEALQHEEWYLRLNAANILVELYRKGSLNDQAKQAILAQHGRMVEPHTDCSGHTDRELIRCGHDDNRWEPHTDHGIGVTL